MSDLADWVAAVGTIGAVLLAVRQLRQNALLALQASATEMWMEYVRTGLDRPELGETRIAVKAFESESVADLVAGNTIDSQRYLWFLTVALDACENLYLHMLTDRWEVTIRQNVAYHASALSIIWDEEKAHYSPRFAALVEDVLAQQSDLALRPPAPPA